jgi:hypothetical protein
LRLDGTRGGFESMQLNRQSLKYERWKVESVC